MALSRERAADALIRVESDPVALATLLAAYAGDEDAVPALREAADPAVASAASLARAARLKEYERAAYGRTSTPDEEAAAAHARDEIVWEEDHRSAISAALEVAVVALDSARDATIASLAQAAQAARAEPTAQTAQTARASRAEAPASNSANSAGATEPANPESAATARELFRFTVPVVVAVVIVGITGIAVGGIIATGAGGQPGATPSATPNPSSTRVPAGSFVTRTYTAKQVSGWFAATATGADTFPQPDYLNVIGLHEGTTRFIATGASGWSLWVGKSSAGKTCLLINGTIEVPTESFSTCLSSAAIAQGRAIVINAHGINATLTRNDFVVAITED